MTIFRMVNGKPVEFTLTPSEMADAFYEQQKIWDQGTVLDALEWAEDPACDILVENLKASKELLTRVAKRFRVFMEDFITGEQELTCARNAYQYVVKCFEMKGD